MGKWNRLEMLIGAENQAKLEKKHVAIIGIGGVGGAAVEALARSSIGALTLIDFDTIDETNINRQIIALNSTISEKKVEIMAKRILDINSHCQVKALDVFIEEKNISNYLNTNVDYIIDACDTIRSKQALLKFALENKIPIISCMGTGNRLDPSKLVVTTLDKTDYDPLAKIMRKWARESHIKSKITVVSSLEHPIKVEGRTPASSAFVPNAAGLLLASYVVKKLLEL